MKNHVKYACSQYLSLLTIFASALTVLTCLSFSGITFQVLAIVCLFMPFLGPFLFSFCNKKFRIRTIGKSKVELIFGDLFVEECIVVTTNNCYDLNHNSDYIADTSVTGQFSLKYRDDAKKCEEEFKSKLKTDKDNQLIPAEYGECLKKTINDKIVYFLVFTDRDKTKQPSDFYTQTLEGFFKKIASENHGKTICLPLIGGNNNLSDTGFSDAEMTFHSMMVMIQKFEIENQCSQLKLKIVAQPEERKNLVAAISTYKK